MKIDKVIFSTSERFSVFWNMQARAWTKLGIHPVCLLFGKIANTDIDHRNGGTVIEVPFQPGIPEILQIVWSKFYWPKHEPETTWLIGDIDLLPLGSRWFTDNIAEIPDDCYVHLDADGITQLSRSKSWVNMDPNNPGMPDRGCGDNLPGHYHCATGKLLEHALDLTGTFTDQLRGIMESPKNDRGFREEDPEHHEWWCCEELRSSRAIRPKVNNRSLKFKGFS